MDDRLPHRPAFDLTSRLVPILAALFVLGVGALCQFVVVRPMLERAPALSIAAEAELVLWLLISTSAVVAALLSSLALSSQRRPLHDLAAQIGVSGVVGAPTPLALPEVGPAALFQVVTRYNALVEMVLRSSDALRSDAALAHARASSEEELSSLVLSHVPSGILAVDARGRVVRANEAALRILDLTMDALDGEELAGVLGESHPLVEATRHDVLRDEFQVSQGQHPRVLGVSSGILRDAAGQAAGHVLVFADLTDLRHLEQQLQMKERLASLGQVAAGLAHEIRNPLGALRGFIELLERRLDEPERARPLFAKVLREADTLSQVVGDFLAFARPAPPRRETIDVQSLLEEACEAGATAAGVEGLHTQILVDADARVLLADAVQLRRALVNFVLNACQATGAGGQVRLRAERRQAVLRLAVEDDGPGVPKEQRLDVVTPFFTTKRGGTGLGLAVAHQIARAHDGELQIEDVEGGGARFVLELPAPEP